MRIALAFVLLLGATGCLRPHLVRPAGEHLVATSEFRVRRPGITIPLRCLTAPIEMGQCDISANSEHCRTVKLHYKRGCEVLHP